MVDITEILELSIKKHGDIPLTIGHLLNIIKLAEKQKETLEDHLDKEGDSVGLF